MPVGSMYSPNVGGRQFRLNVNPQKTGIPFGVIPIRSNKVVSIQISQGVYLYVSNKFQPLPGSKEKRIQMGKTIHNHIIMLINREVVRLIGWWQTNTPKYFNRRAYGRYFGSPNTRANCPRTRYIRPHIITPAMQRAKGRPFARQFTNTGQLGRALRATDINAYGATFYVGSVYAPTNRVDYVRYLINGTRVIKGTPYIPALDKRIKSKNGRWCGITPYYWRRWQNLFEREIKRSETRLNIEISQYVEKLKIAQEIETLILQANRSQQITQPTATRRILQPKITGGRRI